MQNTFISFVNDFHLTWHDIRFVKKWIWNKNNSKLLLRIITKLIKKRPTGPDFLTRFQTLLLPRPISHLDVKSVLPAVSSPPASVFLRFFLNLQRNGKLAVFEYIEGKCQTCFWVSAFLNLSILELILLPDSDIWKLRRGSHSQLAFLVRLNDTETCALS